MSNLRYSMLAPDPIAEPTPSSYHPVKTSTPKAKSNTYLLTILRAHQIMLTNLYMTQISAYISPYTAFTTQCATGELTSAEIVNVVARLLKQQKDIILFQTFLSNFQALLVGLDSGEIGETDAGFGDGKLAKSVGV